MSVEEETRRQTLLAQVVAYYHQTLLNEPEALTYLEKRRLNHPELVSLFKLGYANRTLGYRLPEKKIKAGAEVRAQLQAVGVLRSNGHEHLRGSLVVPVISPDGWSESCMAVKSVMYGQVKRRCTCICQMPIAGCGMRRR